jgi:hypothetical protein
MQHDLFRLEILKAATGLKSFRKNWDSYLPGIEGVLGTTPTPDRIFDLGSHLSEIFQGSTSKRTEGQGALTQGGTAWECLAVWYLNFVFWGTEVIATRHNKKFVPETIRNSIAVTIGSQTTNSESDVLVFSVPGVLPAQATIKDIDFVVSQNLSDVEVGIVQLKTNWNDNSQIPMLWDIVYNSYNIGGNRIDGITVGREGVSPQHFGRFTYSFMTVPTTNLPKPNQVRVARVKGMSGGNYWGRPTQSQIAQSFKEYFGVNFGNYFKAGVLNHIKNNLEADESYLARFLNLRFD